MSTELAKPEDLQTEVLTELVLQGDLSTLSDPEKVEYYRQYCIRLGLDPATQPFQILKLQGKQVLYATRACAAQLNKRDGVSHTILNREIISDCYVVVAKAYTATRQTESIGAVSIAGLKGEALCNAMMKAETKGKRRATLDLCGLGLIDEEEAKSLKESLPPTEEEEKEVLKRVDLLIEASESAQTPEERKRLHEDAMRLEQSLNRRKPEPQSLDKGTVTMVEQVEPPSRPPKKEKAEPVAEPVAGDVICPFGGKGYKDQKLSVIFSGAKTSVMLGKLMGWFEGMYAKFPDESTASFKNAVLECKRLWLEAHPEPAQPSEPQQPTEQPKAPQQPVMAQDWRSYKITVKTPGLANKILGEMEREDLKRIKTEYLDVLDQSRLSVEQKMLKAQLALAFSELFPNEDLLLESKSEPDHLTELRHALESAQLNRHDFMRVARKNDWIACDKWDEITEDEVMELMKGWDEVDSQVRKEQP